MNVLQGFGEEMEGGNQFSMRPRCKDLSGAGEVQRDVKFAVVKYIEFERATSTCDIRIRMNNMRKSVRNRGDMKDGGRICMEFRQTENAIETTDGRGVVQVDRKPRAKRCHE